MRSESFVRTREAWCGAAEPREPAPLQAWVRPELRFSSEHPTARNAAERGQVHGTCDRLSLGTQEASPVKNSYRG